MKVIRVDGVDYKQDQVACVDVDAMKCFTFLCPGELPVTGGDEIGDELNQQAEFAYYRIGAKEAHSLSSLWAATKKHPQYEPIENELNMDTRWNLHGVVGTYGFELLDELPDIPSYTYYVWKGVESNIHPYGVCYHDLQETLSTGVIEYLKSPQIEGVTSFAIIDGKKVPFDKKKVKLVIVGGLATDYCVRLTVLQLLRVGFKVLVNLGACRAITEDTEQAAIEEMHKAGAVFVESAALISFRTI